MSRDRLAGVDAARAAALVGMFATHILELQGPDGQETLTGVLADGRASALFAVLAGVGIALGTGGAAPPAGGRAHAAAAAALVVRGVLVALVGLALADIDPYPAVILAYYGLLFVAAAPLLRLRAPVLGAAAVLAGSLTPVLSKVLRADLPEGPGEQAALGDLADPGGLLVTLGLTGYYPALTWLTYLLAGMAVGRLDLRRTRVAAVLLAGGAVLAVGAALASAALMDAGGTEAIGPLLLDERRYGTTPTGTWWWLATDLPHSGTPPDLLSTTGSALAVLGATLLLARVAPWLVWLPAAAGAVPLTAYTLHVVAVTAYREDSVLLLLAHVAAAVALGVAARLIGRRGPLEGAVAVVSRGAARAVAR